MKQIASFTIDHLRLLRGLYVSRKDRIGNEIITTFDIRMTRPNFEPVMLTGEVHSIEHLGATFLRNHPDFADKTVYFGPMGCRTGFYLLLGGDYESKDILPLMIEMFEFIRDFNGEIPGATAVNCGNFSDMNLDLARFYSKRFLDEVLYRISDEHLNYPV
jgi:S-ribosylhomocysteine lyase